MRRVLAHVLAMLIAAFAQAQQAVHPDELKLKPDIDKAIARGVEALINSQFRDGTWGQYGNFRGGKTALCTYALLKCGVDAAHPTVRRAMLMLDDVQPENTYTVACMMLAYAAAGQTMHRERMGDLTELLLDWQKSGGDYAYPDRARDLSNTQYAALGLWTAQKYKIEVPVKAWQQLMRATMDYQEKPERVKAPVTGKHTVTNGGKIDIAGFSYRRGQKPTGSMTTAGVSILQICKIGLGTSLGAQRKKVDRAIDAGVNWLGHHFAVDKNPGKSDWAYYYLYGIERVGSLTRVEQMGGHWWYVDGARHLLKNQAKDGSWPGGGQLREVRTSFALLFLRRATSGKAPTTGAGGQSAAPQHLYVAGADKDDVAISASGQQPLSIWVTGFGEALTKRHAQYGLRVVQVEYLDGDHIVGQLAGDPSKAWQFDAFLQRAPALARGDHKIRARIELIAHDVPPSSASVQKPAATPATVTVLSPEMSVTIRDVFAPWMKDAARIQRVNLVVFKKTEATASSAAKTARNACDGQEGTQWVCAADDAEPSLEIDLGRSVGARQLMISQAGSRAIDIGLFDRITAIEVRINSSKPFIVKLDPDQLAITTVPFGKVRKVRTLQIRIIDRVPGRRKGQAGFTEIALSK
ncbi:MAG: hypothetical protein ACI8UD_000029 [Planctomycetota bacterium]|jgi:hypothetical protein